MAISILKRPEGYKLSESELSAVSSNSSGDALFTTTFSHGLSTDDVIYIKSESESYNGFKYVEEISATTFKIKNNTTEDPILYTRALTVSYWNTVLTHGWNCAHLPIVYEMLSNVNTVDSGRTISSFTNDNGYTNLNLSGNLGAFEELSYIIIEGAGTSSLDGVYQVIDKISLSDLTISLAYNAANSLAGASINLYTNNYCINVRVYCGIPAGHEAEPYKPMELAATLQLIPDSENKVKFSINEIVRSYLELRNNLTLDTLPNNIDFWTAFYIEYAESYDESDGTTITTFTSDYTTDNAFTGYAVQAVLPFKNIHSGTLSDYIYENTYLAQWLVTQEEPVALVGKYFDLSFIKNIEGIVQVSIQKMISGYAYATETTILNHQNVGVFRIPITPDATYDYFCVQIQIPGSDGLSVPELSEWTNEEIVGSNEPWTDLGTSSPFNDFNGEGGDSDFLVSTEVSDVVIGSTYTFEYSFVIASTGDTDMNMLVFLRHDDGEYQLATIYISSTGTISGSFDAYIDPAEIFNGPYYLLLRKGVLTGESSVRVMSFTADSVTNTPVTEEICIQILDVCDATNTPDPDPTGGDIRLLEDGDYRLLE